MPLTSAAPVRPVDGWVIAIRADDKILHIAKGPALAAHLGNSPSAHGSYAYFDERGTALVLRRTGGFRFEPKTTGGISSAALNRRIRVSFAAFKKKADALPASDPDSPKNPRPRVVLPSLGHTLDDAVEALGKALKVPAASHLGGLRRNPGSPLHNLWHRLMG